MKSDSTSSRSRTTPVTGSLITPTSVAQGRDYRAERRCSSLPPRSRPRPPGPIPEPLRLGASPGPADGPPPPPAFSSAEELFAASTISPHLSHNEGIKSASGDGCHTPLSSPGRSKTTSGR
jgi:hypothetical protein